MEEAAPEKRWGTENRKLKTTRIVMIVGIPLR
jgi:hypothetical protein